eukprot:6419599-Amphidinium_carterae.1
MDLDICLGGVDEARTLVGGSWNLGTKRYFSKCSLILHWRGRRLVACPHGLENREGARRVPAWTRKRLVMLCNLMCPLVAGLQLLTGEAAPNLCHNNRAKLWKWLQFNPNTHNGILTQWKLQI